MKRKTNKTKSIIGLAMGAVIAFGAIPFASMQSILKANADETIKSVYTNTTVSVDNLGFEDLVSGSYNIDDWTGHYVSKDEGAKEKDSTTNKISGALNISPSDYETNFNEQFKESWIDYWKGEHSSLPNVAELEIALNNAITAPTNPLTHNILDETSKNSRVLYLSAGKTFSGYDEYVAGVKDLDVENREVYYTYTSNDFTLDAYSYYKISVWVKTAGGKASISLGKDLEDEYFNGIVSEADGSQNVYIYKKYNSSSDITTYFYKTYDNALTTGSNYTENDVTYTYISDNGTDAWVSDDSYTKITLLSTGDNSGWKEYSIYVSTSYNDENSGKYKTNLQLALGSETEKSSGTVFFDDAKIEKIQYSAYLEGVNASSSNQNVTTADYRFASSYGYRTVSSFNGISELEQADWSLVKRPEGRRGLTISIENEEALTNVYSTFGDSTNTVLAVENRFGDNAVELTSAKTSVEPFNYYRVSIWSRSDYRLPNASSQTFSLYLNATLNSKTVSTKEIKVTPYDSESKKAKPSSINNYWHETVIVVEACPVYTTDVWLSIKIPKKSSFMFDNFVIEEISSKEYNDSKDTKLSLTTSIHTDTITNGHFNLIETKSNEDNELYSAKDWTKSITVKTDLYKYYDDINDSESAYTSIINNEAYTLGQEANKNTITYNDMTFIELVDKKDTFVYTPYRYKLTKYDSNDEPYPNPTYEDLKAMISGSTFEYKGLTFTEDLGTPNKYVYEDGLSGDYQVLEFYGHDTIDPTKKIIVSRNITFSFDEKEDVFKSDLYPKFELYANSLKDDNLHHGIINGFNYDDTILETEDSTYVNPKNVYENYLAISNKKDILEDSAIIKNLKVSYKSSSIAIAKSSYKLISLDAFLDSSFEGDVTVNLLDSKNNVLGTQKLTKKVLTADTDNWQTITFYLKNGLTASAVYLEVVYGSSDASTVGTAMFKTATIEKTTEATFNKLATEKSVAERNDSNASLIQIGGDSFIEIGKDLGDGYYESLKVSKTKESTGNLSILDTSADKVAYANYIYADATNPYVLVIKNNAGQTTTTKSIESYSLSASSYYTFTIVAKAINLESGKSAQIYFDKIDSSLNISSNEFKTYTMYVATDTAITTNLVFELANASGEIVIDSITWATSNKSDFEKVEIEDESLINAVDLREEDEEETDNEDEEIEKDNNTLEILFATLSSLLLVGAIVFALVFTRVNVLKGKGKKPRMKNKVKSSDDDQHGFV